MKKSIFSPKIYSGTFSGTAIYVDPFIILTLTISVLSGGFSFLLILLPAFAVHELAHIIAAYLFECKADAFTLTPFGGRLDFSGLSEKRLCEEIAVLLFAPLSNIVLYSVFYAIGVRANDITLLEISFANGVLALFSLIPAVPLDGGSVLRAVLFSFSDKRRGGIIIFAVNCAVAAFSAAVFVLTMIKSKKALFPLLTLSLLLFFSGLNELKSNPLSSVSDIANRDRLLEKSRILPENRLSVSADATVSKALRAAKSGAVNVYSVYGKNMELIGELTEQELLSAAIIRGVSVSVGSLLR